ncbi:hypothetical protein LY76DRAFT_402495 [Colletotrichum caudatum]|nr:hypothetical protein LY76DRAFT_402495 [Colletotrichum caudatum]
MISATATLAVLSHTAPTFMSRSASRGSRSRKRKRKRKRTPPPPKEKPPMYFLHAWWSAGLIIPMPCVQLLTRSLRQHAAPPTTIASPIVAAPCQVLHCLAVLSLEWMRDKKVL